VAFEGVEITGARVVGDVNLTDVKLIRPIVILDSQVEDAVYLGHARTDSLIVLAGSLMNGTFSADGLQSESDLFLRNGAVFKREMRLIGAKIDGDVDMCGASFDGELNANALEVGSHLLMNSRDKNKTSFMAVDLSSAKVTGLST
jgi:hypothetical protein